MGRRTGKGIKRRIAARLQVALAVLLGMAGVIGLAVLGWGGWQAFSASPARLALIAVALALTVASLFTGANLSTGVKQDRGDRRVLLVFAAIGIPLAYLPALTDRLDLWTLDGDMVRWLGVIVFTAGALLRLWPIFVLGDRFSGFVAIQPGHQLVTTGVYRRIRHPSYLGLLVAALGWALVFRSAAGVLLAVLLVVPVVRRIGAEERLLQAHFGAAYASYRRRTWRLVPYLY
jgi:protein-S-isoprenylcysteine O-methyltransferase Ste14